MIYEDDGAEALVLDEEFDIAIPFAVSVSDGEPEVRVFPSLKKLAVEFLSLFDSSDKIFTTEAIKWAKENFTPFLESNGFTLVNESDDYFLNYRIPNADRSLILNNTRVITSVGNLINLTGYDFDTMSQYGHLCFATVEGDKIVSAACTNYSCILANSESDYREIEIGVETAEGYRGKGYAKSNVTALASMLSDHGYSILYECESGNTASIALANSLHGELYARNFCVVGRKDS
jgi:hypothetical protein